MPELHLHEWGDPSARPLVCLHGVTAHGERFRRLAEERWGTFARVLAPDLRGHGRSSWEPPWTFRSQLDDVLETLDAHGVGEADWVGHSWGGRLVLDLAARAPERIRRAVLLDPAIQILPHVALQSAEGERAEPVYGSVEEFVQVRLDASDLTPREFVEEDARQHLVAQPDGTLRRRTCQAAVVSVYGELASAPPPPETLRAPTLLVHAPAYGLVRDEQLDAYGARDVRVVEVPGMHMVIWDAYETVASEVEAFLRA